MPKLKSTHQISLHTLSTNALSSKVSMVHGTDWKKTIGLTFTSILHLWIQVMLKPIQQKQILFHTLFTKNLQWPYWTWVYYKARMMRLLKHIKSHQMSSFSTLHFDAKIALHWLKGQNELFCSESTGHKSAIK